MSQTAAGVSPAVTATMMMGNSSRMPKTAISTPIVRKSFCQSSDILFRTVALITALSKLSDISSTESIATTTSTSVPPTYSATPKTAAVTATDQPKVLSISPFAFQVAGPEVAISRRLDRHSEISGDTGEAAGVSLADRPELPVTGVSVQLAEHHGRFRRRVLAEVVAGDFLIIAGIDDSNEGVSDHSEIQSLGLGVVDGHREDYFVHRGRDP